MIFLGAGASKPFGIPTMHEFTQKAKEKLLILGHEKILTEIEESLKEFKMVFDFEALYSVLESMNNPRKSITQSGPLMAFYLKKLNILPKAYNYNKILYELRKIIYEECKNLNYEEVRKCYDNLFKSFNSMTSREGGKWVTERDLIDVNKFIVTTNYDMSLELYFAEKEKSIIDGYKAIETPYYKKFNPSSFYESSIDKKSTCILKLHGSIWQYIRNNEQIKTTIDPNLSSLPFNLNIEKEMMIYPTKGKDILNYLYFPFFSYFKNWDWSRLWVIGFSFRDESINNCIMENLITNSNARMVIISPNPDIALKNLITYSSTELILNLPMEKIHKIKGYFGTETTFKDIFDMSNYIQDNFKA
jgi:hypothetical protein